jgi:hypothetical protein
MTALRPFHSRLRAEGLSSHRRPLEQVSDEQQAAAAGFMEVLQAHLATFMQDLRKNAITDVCTKDKARVNQGLKV